MSKENSNHKQSRLLLVSFPLRIAKTFLFKSHGSRKGKENQIYLSQIKTQELFCKLERYINPVQFYHHEIYRYPNTDS